MKRVEPNHEAVNEYIAAFPSDVQTLLQSIRKCVREVAPDAIEKISYQMPAFYQGGNLLCFAAFKNHVSIFPGPEAIVAFEKDLKKYPTSKGTIQFPLDSALPLDLIQQIVKYRLKENGKKGKKHQ